MPDTRKRLVVIGGGAAGFFCAVNAARLNPSLEVVILEKSGKLLSKVKVSGGGRCNVTHACFSIPDMIRHYPRGANFLKKAFHHFFTTHTIEWFEQRGVFLKTEEDGRMFPVTNSSQTVIDCLMGEANKYGIEIIMNAEVRSLRPESGIRKLDDSAGRRFSIELSGSRILTADFICIATGGYPKSSHFNWLKALGHTIAEPVPSLFTFNMPGNAITRLMGVSVPEAQVRISGTNLQAKGPLLITHWGMSGPVILRLSAWGARELANNNYQFTVLVNWLPQYNEQTLRAHFQHLRFDLASQQLGQRNPFHLPQRLWQFFLQQSGIDENKRWADLPVKEQNKLITHCCAQSCTVQGKTTFKEEFVTAGGIQLTEIDANTMQSKIIPYVFFAGEILDVDGITGGFNFQNAWTSGFIAAGAVAGAEV